MGRLQIDVLGSSFAIEAKEDDTYLKRLLSYYAEMAGQIEQKSNLSDPLQVSILSGIMLCDELYKEKSKNLQYSQQDAIERQEAERLTAEMINKIDKALK